MIQIEFSPTSSLPDAPIDPRGPLGIEFALRGVATIAEAAAWLAALPYGPNDVSDATAVLRDGQGTCTTKHAALITLAGEAGQAIDLWWGLYALDESVVEGAGVLLTHAGIPFAPNIHCFLGYAERYVDLTLGNCTGKRGDIEDYLAIDRATVGASDTAACREATVRLCHDDQRFSGVSPDHVMATRAQILDLVHPSCRSTP
jgi:hypothetical protein